MAAEWLAEEAKERLKGETNSVKGVIEKVGSEAAGRVDVLVKAVEGSVVDEGLFGGGGHTADIYT